jgi:hypothetical protein
MEKVCVWCLKTSKEVTFNNEAHIFPQSLGGRIICENVCDECNRYFGAKQNPDIPSVEVAFKEPLNISKHYIQSQSETKIPSRLSQSILNIT